MNNGRFVFVVQDTDGKVIGVFKHKDNAENSIPESYRTIKRQHRNNVWLYFSSAREQFYCITDLPVSDFNDLRR